MTDRRHGPAYDSHRGFGRRPRSDAWIAPPLTYGEQLALYIFSGLVLFTVFALGVGQ